MRVRLLPSACGGTGAAPQFLSSYLVGEAIAIDAGSVGLQADLELQRRVRHVFLTHAHLDHVASLPLLVENTYAPGPDCLEVLASADTLAQVRGDLFNDRTWPDFFRLSTRDDAFVTSTRLEPLVTIERAGCRITPIPVSHSCETLAMVVDDGSSCVAFAADTGPTELLWRELARRPTLRGVFLECSFPNALQDLATRTGHLCPATFAGQLAQLPADVPVFAVHGKAAHAQAIGRELAALGTTRVELVRPGLAYEL
jgi:ribonuclease BN (tRNA processing enzyme)